MIGEAFPPCTSILVIFCNQFPNNFSLGHGHFSQIRDREYKRRHKLSLCSATPSSKLLSSRFSLSMLQSGLCSKLLSIIMQKDFLILIIMSHSLSTSNCKLLSSKILLADPLAVALSSQLLGLHLLLLCKLY